MTRRLLVRPTFVQLSALAIAAASLLGGCATSRQCLGVQPYQQARTLPVPPQVEGGPQVAASGALRIPPPVANPVPFGQEVKDENGKLRAVCLDAPPRLPVDPELNSALTEDVVDQAVDEARAAEKAAEKEAKKEAKKAKKARDE